MYIISRNVDKLIYNYVTYAHKMLMSELRSVTSTIYDKFDHPDYKWKNSWINKGFKSGISGNFERCYIITWFPSLEMLYYNANQD
jgi:hypothetical protein